MTVIILTGGAVSIQMFFSPIDIKLAGGGSLSASWNGISTNPIATVTASTSLQVQYLAGGYDCSGDTCRPVGSGSISISPPSRINIEACALGVCGSTRVPWPF